MVYFINQVAGYAVGGGHVLHMVCDLTIAADNAIFGQTGPKVLIYLYYILWGCVDGYVPVNGCFVTLCILFLIAFI